jgi:hypothetical protein
MKVVLTAVAACGVASASLANPSVYITNSFASSGFINAVSNEGTAVGVAATSEFRV